MHEFSLATSLVDLVLKHCPKDEELESITVEAGPMRGIDRQAMQWAWQAATDNTLITGSKIELIEQPWKLHCPDCHTDFIANDMFTNCSCGCQKTTPIDSDTLRLVRLTLKEPATQYT